MADTQYLKDNLKGFVPRPIANDIIELTTRGSSILRLCNVQAMESDNKTFPVMTDGVGAYWVGESELPAIPQMPSFEQITSGISNNSSNSTTNNNTSSNMTFTGDINITNPDNFDSIVFELMKLMGKSSMNFGGVGL